MVWHLGASSKVKRATHQRAKAPRDGGPSPEHRQAPTEQGANPGLPSTLHLRATQGVTRKIINTDLEMRASELSQPAGHWPSEQAP